MKEINSYREHICKIQVDLNQSDRERDEQQRRLKQVEAERDYAQEKLQRREKTLAQQQLQHHSGQTPRY